MKYYGTLPVKFVSKQWEGAKKSWSDIDRINQIAIIRLMMMLVISLSIGFLVPVAIELIDEGLIRLAGITIAFIVFLSILFVSAVYEMFAS